MADNSARARKLRRLALLVDRLIATKPKLSPEARAQIEAQADKLRADLNRKAN